jgi:hypothetical protein
MRAIEFQAVIKDDKIAIPSAIKGKVKSNCKMRVILLIEEDEDENVWKRLAAENFFNGYSEEDARYDNL